MEETLMPAELMGSAEVNMPDQTHRLELRVEQEGRNVVVTWTYTPTPGNEQTGTVVFDSAQSFFPSLLHLPANATPLAICLATCVGKSLAEPVIECVLSVGKDPVSIISCLKKKGLQVAAHA